jgi:probable addiction module antidote protein
MPKRTVNFREQLLEDLANPEEAAQYLNAAAEDSEEMLLIALRDIAEAKQMAHVAERAGVAREALYRMLNKSGNPTYNSLRGVLHALGIRMCFAPVEKPSSGPRRDKKVRIAAGKSKYR